MRNGWVLLIFLIIGMLIALSPSAEAYCNITNSSGSFTLVDDTYVTANSILVANVSCGISDSGASGVLIINASDITLDCNGTNLVGTSSNRGIFQDSNSNVTIKNCNITNYDIGIYLKSSSNNTLINNTATLNDFFGFYIHSSSNNTLINNTANLNTGTFGYGFYMYSDSNYNQLTGNTANWNEGRGFCLYSDPENNTLTNNTANWNDEYGFYIHTSPNTTLKNNTMSNNAYNFLVYGKNDSQYNNSIDISNTVNAKPIYYKVGVQDQVYDSATNAGFFACVFCKNVTVKDVILTNNSHGILFWKTNDSIVQNVTVNTNYYGMRMDLSYSNNITNNNANSNDFGIRLESGSNNNTLTNNIANSNSGSFGYGFYLHSNSNNTLINNTANWNEECGFYLDDSNKNQLINNTADSNADYGFHLESSYNNTLKSNNITISGTQYGFYFEAVNDLENNIDRTNKVNGKEVLVIANNNQSVTISDFEGTFNPQIRITNYGIINFYNCNNKIIRNVTIINSTNYGIYLHSSNNNTLTNNTANKNSNHGIYLYDSSNNNLTNNTANSNVNYGYYLSLSSNNNTITNNIANWNNYGFYLKLNSNRNQLINNTANWNTGYGFNIDSSGFNQLINNTAISNNYGFYLYLSLINTLTNNTAISNSQYGVYMIFLSDFNNITYNHFCFNGQALYNDTDQDTIDNNTFCVDPISPANNTWFSSVSNFTFNVSNPIYTTSCQLYIDDSYSALNSSVSNNVLSNISSTPSQGSHTWYVYCNNSASSNWGTSSLRYFGIKQSDSSACSSSEHCLSGYCVHDYCRSAATHCGDGYCDSGETCSSCSSDCGVCTSSRSSSGSTSLPSLPSKTQSWSLMTPGVAHVMNIEDPEMGLKQIEIIVESEATSVSIRVEKLESKPAEIVHEVVGNVYSYFKISHSNIQNKIEKAIIEFQVNRSWINSNKIDSDTVTLNRYTTEWEILPTKKVSENESYIYYKAETTAFSVFAMSGDYKVGKTVCPYDCCVNETNYTDKPCSEAFECDNNECIAVPPELQCPTCPEPTNWTECANETIWRTSYRCSPVTNYTCQKFTEERGCEIPTAPPILIWVVVIAVIAVLIAFFIWKGIIKIPKTSNR